MKVLLAIVWFAGAVVFAGAAGALALDPLVMIGNGRDVACGSRIRNISSAGTVLGAAQRA